MNENLDRHLQKHDAQISQCMLEINSINHSINESKRLIEELNVKFEAIDRLKDLHQKFDNLSQYVKKDLDAFKVQAENLRKTVDDFLLKISQFRAIQIDMLVKQDAMAVAQEKNFHYHNKRLQEVETNQTERISNYREEFQLAMEKLKDQLSMSPVAIFEQNNQMINKLESASLDGSNAMLKVNNMDMKITIIEKKIENLAIQIKRVELQAQ
jgi:hypothetical protein